MPAELAGGPSGQATAVRSILPDMGDLEPTPVNDDTLDGCDVDFVEHADDEDTAALRALFPDGLPHDGWEGVKFDADAA